MPDFVKLILVCERNYAELYRPKIFSHDYYFPAIKRANIWLRYVFDVDQLINTFSQCDMLYYQCYNRYNEVTGQPAD